MTILTMRVVFPGGKRVDAEYKGFTVHTDQPEKAGGGNSAPSPFDLFLASIGTCAGFYVLSFCQERGISTEGVELAVNTERNPETGLVGRIDIAIQVPGDFPEQYKEALARAAGLCAVKKHLAHPPEFTIHTEVKS